MKICGIIFDKDGTLLDFNKFWVSITDKAMDEILQKCGADISLKPKVLSALGVVDGDTDITGQLCSGTYESMGRCRTCGDKHCMADSGVYNVARNRHRRGRFGFDVRTARKRKNK